MELQPDGSALFAEAEWGERPESRLEWAQSIGTAHVGVPVVDEEDGVLARRPPARWRRRAVAAVDRRERARRRRHGGVAREEVRVAGATATWSDDYLFVAHPPVGAALRIDFPLAEQELVLSERLHIEPIRTRLCGDEVVAMDNFGAEWTFFDPYF